MFVYVFVCVFVFVCVLKNMQKLKCQKEKEWQDELEMQQKTIRDHLQSKMTKANQDEDAHIAELVEKQNATRDVSYGTDALAV